MRHFKNLGTKKMSVMLLLHAMMSKSSLTKPSTVNALPSSEIPVTVLECTFEIYCLSPSPPFKLYKSGNAR